jgi:bacteriochlorophyll 4-vinyl reductase
MTRENGVGRVLVASLHQAIADVLPTRLGFYESWLNAEGLREGTIGLAPFYAVLSFLRQEEGTAYAEVTTRAGEYAAEWTVESMSPSARRTIANLPRIFRQRVILGRAHALVQASYGGSRAVWRIRSGTATVNLRASVFCSVREPSAHPLCQYYAAAFERMLARFDIATTVEVVSCRGTGEGECCLSVPFAVMPAAPSAESA